MSDDQASPSYHLPPHYRCLALGLKLPIMTPQGITILHFNSSALSVGGVGTESSEVSGWLSQQSTHRVFGWKPGPQQVSSSR